MLKKAKCLYSKGSYRAYALFVLDEDGNWVSAGFGIFTSSGTFVEH